MTRAGFHCGYGCVIQITINGVKINSPTASPSNQVSQMPLNCSARANPVRV